MNSHSKHTRKGSELHDDVHRLLKKYKCPMSYDQVRARFMGAIASPVDRISPMDEIIALWNDQLPIMKDLDELNQLIQALTMNLWNSLTVHTHSQNPFKFSDSLKVTTQAELIQWAKTKREEIEAFIAGYFQGQDSIKLSAEVCDGLDVLEDLVGMFAGVAQMPALVPEDEEFVISKSMQHMNKLNEILHIELNKVIQASSGMRPSDRPLYPFHLH